jgi:nucleoside-diphosphate-sugar epimerase
LIHVEDLVDGFLTVAEHPAALQDVFICGDPAPVTLMDIVKTAGAVYGVRNHFIRIPVAPVMAVAVVCERLCVPLRIQPPIFPRRVGFFTKDRAFNTSKIRRVLGYESMHETIAGIQETARWYRANGWA